MLYYDEQMTMKQIGQTLAGKWSLATALGERGVRLTDFYVSQAVCGASRASLLTGCYAERVGYRVRDRGCGG